MKTVLLPLHNYRHKSREDIILWYVNKFENGEGQKNEIPIYKPVKKYNFSLASAYAFSKEIISSLRP